jgi:hypothetical protein
VIASRTGIRAKRISGCRVRSQSFSAQAKRRASASNFIRQSEMQSDTSSLPVGDARRSKEAAFGGFDQAYLHPVSSRNEM